MKLKDNKEFMRYFKNTSFLLIEKILRIILGVFIGIWLARYLGPEQFGLFSYALSFVGLFATIATLGLDEIIVRELIKDKLKRDVLLGTAFFLKLIGSMFVLLIITIAVNFTSNDSSTNILIFIIASSTIFQSFNVIEFYFQSKVLSIYVVFAKFLSLICSSIIKITLILYDAPLITFAYVIFFESFILAMGLIYSYFYNKLSLVKWNFKKEIMLSLLKDSWPLVLSGLVVSVYMKIDQVMIKELLGNNFVGEYAAAVRLSEAWYFIAIILASSLFPAIISAKKKNEKIYYDRLQLLYNSMVWIAVAIALPITFLSDWGVAMLYGESYVQTASVLKIHIWTAVFVFIGVASGKWLIIENLQILAFWRTFTGMVVNIILNYILIKGIGITGAAIATFCSQVIAAYLFDFFLKDTRKTFYMKSKSLTLFWSFYEKKT